MPADTEEHPERIDAEENGGLPMASERGDRAALSTMAEHGPPYPPFELAHRVGSLEDATDPFAYYDTLGRETRDAIVDRLPPDWTFDGKRILDFGCGAGRTLRHFAGEAATAEFWGCDIDEESVRWMEEHMSPPFHVFVNGEEPPLEQPDSSFDLIFAISVFTHLTSSWGRWLVELHRVLKPDGLLLVTFMGCGMSEEIAGEPWDAESFGMNVIRYGQSWDLGGPMVIHSPWWIEEHWGRAFEILSLAPDGFAAKPWLDHGSVLMRKREQTIDPAELERIAPGDTREVSALAHNVQQLHGETLDLREGLTYLDSKLGERIEHGRLLEAQLADLAHVRDELGQARGELDRAGEEAIVLHRETTAAQQRAATAQDRSLNSARRLLEVEEDLAQAKARIFALEEAIDELQPKLERAEGVMAGMRRSISWRVTAPLRALKRLR
jgi:SAM-dependent methyltransferase